MRVVVIGLLGLLLGGCASVETKTLDYRGEADAAYAMDDCAKAVPLYEQIPQAQRDDMDWYRYGNCLTELDQTQQAVVAFQRSLANNPKFAQARHNLGVLQLKLGVKNLIEARGQLVESDDVYQDLAFLLKQLAELVYGE